MRHVVDQAVLPGSHHVGAVAKRRDMPVHRIIQRIGGPDRRQHDQDSHCGQRRDHQRPDRQRHAAAHGHQARHHPGGAQQPARPQDRDDGLGGHVHRQLPRRTRSGHRQNRRHPATAQQAGRDHDQEGGDDGSRGRPAERAARTGAFRRRRPSLACCLQLHGRCTAATHRAPSFYPCQRGPRPPAR